MLQCPTNSTTIIKHLDTLRSKKDWDKTNNIKKTQFKLKGYNTDYLASKNLFNKFKNKKILILQSFNLLKCSSCYLIIIIKKLIYLTLNIKLLYKSLR